MSKKNIKSHIAKHKISLYTLIILSLIFVLQGSVTFAKSTFEGSNNGPTSSFGGSNSVTTVTLQNPLKVDSIGAAVNAALDIFAYVAVLVGVLMLIWTGFQLILAQGNSKKLEDLKAWLLYIVIGIALIIGARIIIRVVITTLESTGTLNTEVINSAHNALDGK